MHMKSSTLSVVRKIQIKTTMRNHYTPSRMSKIKRPTIVCAGEDVEQLELSDTAGRTVK